jgi:hypothetical protein
MASSTLSLSESAAPTLVMATVATLTALEASRRKTRWISLIVAVALAVALCAGTHYAVTRGAWAACYARYIMPDVIVASDGHLTTPPAATVQDGYIVEWTAPAR